MYIYFHDTNGTLAGPHDLLADSLHNMAANLVGRLKDRTFGAVFVKFCSRRFDFQSQVPTQAWSLRSDGYKFKFGCRLENEFQIKEDPTFLLY